jgi:hypothetical protein
MNKIKSFFLKYWLFIFLVIIIITLLGFYIKVKIYSPKNQENLLLITIPKIESYPISIPLDTSQIEKKISSFNKTQEAYQVTQSSFSNEKAIFIGEKFGFLDPPTVFFDNQEGSVYNWSDQENYLSINLRWGSIDYRINPSLKNNSYSFPEFSQVEKISKDFLNKNDFLPPKLISLKINDIYYVNDSGFGLEKVESSQNANLVKIIFDFEINNKKIIGPSITMGIDSSSKITYFNYQTTFREITFLDNYPLKTKEEIIQILKTKPTVNYLYIPNYYGATQEEFKNINNIVLENIELIYYKYNPLQLYLQPFFLITGKATLKNGTQGEVGSYLPAIKDEYLLK